MRWRNAYFFALLIAGPAHGARVTGVEAVAIPVANLQRSLDFYTKVLTFEKVKETEVSGPEYGRIHDLHGARPRLVWLRLGDETLLLADYGDKRGRPVPLDSRSNDRWFQHAAIIVSDLNKAYTWLENHHVAHASDAPQTLPAWNKTAAGIKAYYFKDPDGHTLEILQFPQGKGDPKWARRTLAGDHPQGYTPPLFLGIDHTAIVVKSTAESLAFYRDQLGMVITGESDNYGPEQERLNNVPGAHLRITSLRAAAGPGVEFLEYLSPTDGRPYPRGSHANDLWQWETILMTDNMELSEHDLWRSSVPFVSRTAETIVEQEGKTLLVRDPDGHAVELVEAPHEQN